MPVATGSSFTLGSIPPAADHCSELISAFPAANTVEYLVNLDFTIVLY